MIYSEELLSMLCDDHIRRAWREGLYTLEAVMSKTEGGKYGKNVREFINSPLVLTYRLHCIFEDAKRRGIHFKGQIEPYDVSDEAFLQGMDQMKKYIPMYSIAAQKEDILSRKCCDRHYFRY
jgi:hypothetical protein